MALSDTILVLNQMVADGVIRQYAIGGAWAAIYYAEPVMTEDLDVLISFDDVSGADRPGLVLLTPILTYLAAKGYSDFQKEGLSIEGWPVQFLPVADALDAEALEQAQQVDLGGVSAWILRPEHLVATALKVGRAKDLVRVAQFLEQELVETDRLCTVLKKHGLSEEWSTFCVGTGMRNPCRDVS